MSEQGDDREMDEYLQGRSPVSARYREAAREEPPAAVDEAILAASRRAVQSRPRLIPMTWFRPLSIAAVVVLSAALIITVQRDEKGAALSASPPPVPGKQEVPAPAASGYGEPAQLQKKALRELESEVLLDEVPAARAEESPRQPPAAASRMPEAKARVREQAAVQEPAADMAVPGGMPLRQELAEIARLWRAGKTAAARERLDLLLAHVPPPADAELRTLLPAELYEEVRSTPAP